MASSADPNDIPGRPEYVNSFVQGDPPIPATAVRATAAELEREREEARLAGRPHSVTVHLPAPRPEMRYFARCFAYAYITPASAPCKDAAGGDPAPSIRAAVGAALPDLRFELIHPSAHGADRMVRFPTPEDREAAMARQPFALDGGASLALVREGETPNVRRIRMDTLAHVALRDYPREQRSAEEIRGNCSSFGRLLEVDPACLAADAPDMSPVRAVLSLEHASKIPREVRIRWAVGAFRHVVPVQILRVWDWSESLDANGQYVPMYGPDALVAR